MDKISNATSTAARAAGAGQMAAQGRIQAQAIQTQTASETAKTQVQTATIRQETRVKVSNPDMWSDQTPKASPIQSQSADDILRTKP